MAYGRPGVYVSETLLPAPITSVGTANAAGAVVAPFAQGPEAVTRVTSWYEFATKFGGYNASFPATFGVAAFFNNGGRELFVKRLMHSDAEYASVDLKTSGNATVATVTSKNRGTDGNNLRVTLEAGTVSDTYTLTVYKEGVAGTASDVTNDTLLERYENIVFNDGASSDFAETVVNLVSPNITISDSATGVPVTTNPYPLSGGLNGSAVVAADYTAYNGGTAFDEFSSFDRAFVLFFPNIFQTLSADQDLVYASAISWAEANDGFVVVETAPNLTTAAAMTFASGLGSHSNAAVYFPHFYTTDPLGRSTQALRKVGPSGAIAGLYLGTDATRGVFKAPAGIALPLSGIVSLEKPFSSTELDTLNSGVSPVNPIRQVPGAGIAVMGARTLKQDGTANKYVNMRRSLIYIKKRLKGSTEFAIFENNDEILWARIRTLLTIFLNEYRNQGGLRGANAASSFFVKCDGENNTAASIQNGEVHIQVGVALQYPAEFIVIDLSQKTLN
jgi:phage tail sheath protein FI